MAYLTSSEIEAELTTLATGPGPSRSKIAFANPTASEGMGPTTYSYLKLDNGAGPGRTNVLIVAGMHGDELAQPDAVISFIDNLLKAYRTSTAFVVPAYTDAAGHTFGPFSLPANTIQRIVDAMDILFVPLANPDGRAFSLTTPVNSNWRKNRAPPLAIPMLPLASTSIATSTSPGISMSITARPPPRPLCQPRRVRRMRILSGRQRPRSPRSRIFSI